MKIKLLLLLFFSLPKANTTLLPEQFTITERLFSLTSTFDVSANGTDLAVARKHFFSLTPSFDLEDSARNLLATYCSRFFTWGTIADVIDANGEEIGRIEEELFRILPWSEYKVFDSKNELIAIAKMDFWGTEFKLSHPIDFDEVYATISRPFLRLFRDYWTVQIKDFSVFEDQIDPRLLLILAIYQTDKDNRDRVYKEMFHQLKQDQNEYEGRRFD